MTSRDDLWGGSAAARIWRYFEGLEGGACVPDRWFQKMFTVHTKLRRDVLPAPKDIRLNGIRTP